MKYLLFFLATSPALAALSPAIVKESAVKYHPTVQAAIEKLRAGQEGVVGARGAFDAKIVSDYKRQTKHGWNTEDYPSNLGVFLEKLDLSSNIDELIKRRPDMRNLALNVEKNDVDVELAKQDLKPQIDVAGEYFHRTIEHPQGQPRDYLMVLAQVNIPIERNLGNGNIAAARARKMVAQKELNYGQQSYKVEVMALRKALHLQLEQATQSEIEFTKAKELVVSETYKFKTGGGNLFLVNLREEAQASAEASFHESRLSFMNTLLTYQAMVSTVE